MGKSRALEMPAVYYDRRYCWKNNLIQIKLYISVILHNVWTTKKETFDLGKIDDSFMRALFKGNIPLAKMILRIVMAKSDLSVTSLKTQEDTRRVTSARLSALLFMRVNGKSGA